MNVLDIRAPQTPTAGEARDNRLLAALPPSDLLLWLPHLDRVNMPLGMVLHESGSVPKHVYFPTSSIVSLMYLMETGASAEVAVVGNDGVVGVSVFMGGESSPSRTVVQRSGCGFRLSAAIIQAAFGSNGPVKHLMLLYTQALMTQMIQTAACNRHHRVEQQLCRWLLLSFDRLDNDSLGVTHERISHMLGVRRESVTAAALALQKAGLITCSRGCISVLNRRGLERRSCECYRVVKKEHDRLLPMAA